MKPEIEINLFRAALIKAKGNQQKASEFLGVTRKTMNNKLRRYPVLQEYNAARDYNKKRDYNQGRFVGPEDAISKIMLKNGIKEYGRDISFLSEYFFISKAKIVKLLQKYIL